MIYFDTKKVTQIFMGAFGSPKIYLGSYMTFPTGTVTTALTNVGLVYSTGSKLNAGGSNYAQIRGTLITYVDGSEDSRETIALTPTLVSSATWVTIEGTKIYGADRDIVAGSDRSVQVYSNYAGQRYGNYTVTQEANAIVSTAPGAITEFRINGETGTTINTDSSGKTLYVTNLYGYKVVTFTSTATAQTTIQNYLCTSSESWATVNMNGNRPSSVTITKYQSDTVPTRSTVITVRDSEFTSVQKTITISQHAANEWEFEVPSACTIEGLTTSFNILITARYMGSQFPITTDNISISPNGSNLAVSEIYHYGSGSYRITFTGSTNETADAKHSYITIVAGPNQATCHVTQESTTQFVGMHVKYRYGDWVIGTVTTTKNTGPNQQWDVAGIIVAKKEPITGNANVSISGLYWQYLNTSVSTTVPQSVSETNLTQTISAGTTINVSNADVDQQTHTYYGYWLTAGSPSKTPTLGLQLNAVSGFNVTET